MQKSWAFRSTWRIEKDDNLRLDLEKRKKREHLPHRDAASGPQGGSREKFQMKNKSPGELEVRTEWMAGARAETGRILNDLEDCFFTYFKTYPSFLVEG